jgi:DNA-binding NtrC family response regulator
VSRLAVLVVDDEPGMRDTLVAILEQQGYSVSAAPDGETALSAVQEEPYDVVVMDVRMPGRDGVSVLEDMGDPPPQVILMTAYALEEQLRAAVKAKAFAILHKPFDTSRMLGLVADACPDRQSAPAPARAPAGSSVAKALAGSSVAKAPAGSSVAKPPAGSSVAYVVDDDPALRQTVVEILALAGISAAGFGSGASAQEPRNGTRPDLAVVDQRLPDTTGIALATKLKSEDPDLGVILLTGYASADNAIAAVGLVDDYLTKPVPPDDLVRSVKAALDRTRLRRENRQLVTRLQELNSSLEATVAERTRELEAAHRRALENQATRERLQAQAERERLENRLQQSQRMESLGQLAGGVAHDFNNLLAVILNCASFVSEATADNQSAHDDVAHIRVAAEQAAQLTRQLLIFARRDRVQLEVLDLNAVVAGVQGLLARSIGEQVRLVVRTAASLPAIRADQGQLEQVLINLAVNARDAMPDGGTLTIEPSVTVLDEEYARLHPEVIPGRYVQLAVSDNGVGMNPDVARHIFEPFFTTKPQGKGTGLGLATVHGIVTAAGGALSVSSEPGAGTTIRAFFPVTQEQASAAATDAVTVSIPGSGETILVVEDEPAVLAVTARILRGSEYAVLTATTGAEALALAADHEFNLLLTDLVMPDISGLELAKRFRQIRPETAVLFMSGYSPDALGPPGPLGEGIALVQKPFTGPALLERVRAALAG